LKSQCDAYFTHEYSFFIAYFNHEYALLIAYFTHEKLTGGRSDFVNFKYTAKNTRGFTFCGLTAGLLRRYRSSQ